MKMELKRCPIEKISVCEKVPVGKSERLGRGGARRMNTRKRKALGSSLRKDQGNRSEVFDWEGLGREGKEFEGSNRVGPKVFVYGRRTNS